MPSLSPKLPALNALELAALFKFTGGVIIAEMRPLLTGFRRYLATSGEQRSREPDPAALVFTN